MLKIVIPKTEFFNEATSEFCYIEKQTLILEHSLLSISKWESKWKKPFIDNKVEKTKEEMFSYIECMTINKHVDPMVYKCFNNKIITDISEYIKDSMTATWFPDDKSKSINREIVTAEIVYYWMITFGIPFECERWHFNRLITLIRVCSAKSKTTNKMSKRKIMEDNASLNAIRRQAYNTKG